MDPNETLARIRALNGRMLECPGVVVEGNGNPKGALSLAELEELAILNESLDTWLSNGGFLPSAWSIKE